MRTEQTRFPGASPCSGGGKPRRRAFILAGRSVWWRPRSLAFLGGDGGEETLVASTERRAEAEAARGRVYKHTAGFYGPEMNKHRHRN